MLSFLPLLITMSSSSFCLCFFFDEPATTVTSTLSLHDALPISAPAIRVAQASAWAWLPAETVTSPRARSSGDSDRTLRSEEHTSELQSRQYLVCRLLLEKKKKAIESTYWQSHRYRLETANTG